MLPNRPMPILGVKLMPEWLREILVSLSVATVTTMVLVATIAFGVFVAIKIGDGRPMVAVVAAVGFLLFVVLPLRLWLTMRRSRSK